MVEDNKADVFLIRESIENARLDADLKIVGDGEQAIQFFEQADQDPAAPCPDLVILDINLPKRQGRDVLQQMRKSRRCADAAVMVVTSSDSDKDREDMRKLGVKIYFRKPSEYEKFLKLGDLARQVLEEAGPGPSRQ